MPCRCYRVSGRVQGVFYRASTQEQAVGLGVTGYAKNLIDGTVEVMMCGSEDALETLLAWLHQGPPAARVDAVSECSASMLDTPTTFQTL